MSQTATNGRHRAASSPPAVSDTRPGRVEDRVVCNIFSIPKDEQVRVWMLSPHYGGCWVHYAGKNYYCRGSDCPARLHQREREWKGYAAALVYDPVRDKWRPWVLEITPHMELDLRDWYQRGQIWTCFRAPLEDGHKPCCQAVLTETRSDQDTPKPFNVQAVLYNRYRCDVRLDVKNPMPPRLYLAEVDGQRPEEFQEKPACSPEERAAAIKELIERNRRLGSPDRHNGA